MIEASPNACDRQETGTKNLLVTEEDHGRQRVAGKENTHVIETGPRTSHVIGKESHAESSRQVVDQNNGRIGKAGVLDGLLVLHTSVMRMSKRKYREK